jgi:hypothetical protein
MSQTPALLNLTDVPAVSARELSVAVKLLALHGASLHTAHTLPDATLRTVCTAYWSLVSRDSARKTATVVRFQNLIAVCASRRLQGLLQCHGREALAGAIAAAATSRLNTAYGFNPLKIARRVRLGLALIERREKVEIAA